MKNKLIVFLSVCTLLLTACSTGLFASTPVNTADGITMQWAFTKKEQHPEQMVIDTINTTNQTLDIAIYSLTHPAIVGAIKDAKKRGVIVRLIVDQEQSQGKAMNEALKLLGSQSIPIKHNIHSGLMHLKTVISDKHIVLFGSFNFSKAAASYNDEVLARIDNKEVTTSFNDEFQSMWDSTEFANVSAQIAMITPEKCTNPTIKGNSKSYIYHVPRGTYYDSLQRPVLFCSEKEAISAGYRKSKT